MIRFAFIGMILLSTSLAAAQVPLPDPNLWSPVLNPNLEVVVPAVIYDPGDGMLWLDTSGIDQDPTQVSRTQIDGDNVGFIAMAFEVIEPASDVFLDGFVDQTIGGVVWINNYVEGQQQIFGVPASGADFLQPAKRTNIYRFSPGLSQADFGEVEMGVNFSWGPPGATMFGSVQFVPEPSSATLLAIALFGILNWRRLRRTSQLKFENLRFHILNFRLKMIAAARTKNGAGTDK